MNWGEVRVGDIVILAEEGYDEIIDLYLGTNSDNRTLWFRLTNSKMIVGSLPMSGPMEKVFVVIRGGEKLWPR